MYYIVTRWRARTGESARGGIVAPSRGLWDGLGQAGWRRVLTNVYRLSKMQVVTIFDHLKRLSNVDFGNETVFARALAEYRDRGCDFPDALVGFLNPYYGYATASFDRQAGRKLGFELL